MTRPSCVAPPLTSPDACPDLRRSPLSPPMHPQKSARPWWIVCSPRLTMRNISPPNGPRSCATNARIVRPMARRFSIPGSGITSTKTVPSAKWPAASSMPLAASFLHHPPRGIAPCRSRRMKCRTSRRFSAVSDCSAPSAITILTKNGANRTTSASPRSSPQSRARPPINRPRKPYSTNPAWPPRRIPALVSQ